MKCLRYSLHTSYDLILESISIKTVPEEEDSSTTKKNAQRHFKIFKNFWIYLQILTVNRRRGRTTFTGWIAQLRNAWGAREVRCSGNVRVAVLRTVCLMSRLNCIKVLEEMLSPHGKTAPSHIMLYLHCSLYSKAFGTSVLDAVTLSCWDLYVCVTLKLYWLQIYFIDISWYQSNRDIAAVSYCCCCYRCCYCCCCCYCWFYSHYWLVKLCWNRRTIANDQGKKENEISNFSRK